jgi:hypothetical protein
VKRLWLAIPKKVRWALVGIVAIAIACLRFFFLGKREGREAAETDAALATARQRAKDVEDLAAAGDDAGVQKKLAEAAARAARTTGRN